MIFRFGISAVAFSTMLLTTSPAPAADGYNWTGFYLGVNGGYGWGSSSAALSPNDPSSTLITTSLSPQGASFDTSGALVGLQLGYNWQLGRSWLIGAEADFNFSDIKGSGRANSAIVFAGITSSTDADLRVRWFGTARGRLAHLPMPDLLIYATGGLAYGRVEQNASFNNTSAVPVFFNVGGFSAICAAFSPCFAGSEKRTALGWTAGGGLEYRIWKSITFKAEYLYVNLGDNNFNITAQRITPGLSPATFAAQFDQTSFHVARLGLNYGF